MIFIEPEVNIKQESPEFEAVELASPIIRQRNKVGCETLYLITRVSIKYDKIIKNESTSVGDNNFEIEEINEQNVSAEDRSMYESEFGTNENIHTYQCKICEYRTRQIESLLKHFTVKHKESVELELEDGNVIKNPVLIDYGSIEFHHCSFCDYKTNRKDNLTRHMRLKHDDTAEWYNCQICEYKTKDRNQLNQHKLRRHDVNVEWHQCRFCDYRTKSKHDLKGHFKVKHDETAEWNQCALCEYKTKAKQHLNQHFLYRHTDRKQLRCDFCEYVTQHKNRLERHLKIRHDEKAEIFHCNFCEYNTKSKSDLAGHLEYKHVSDKEYKCEVCNYKTRLKVSLLDHVNKEHDMVIDHDSLECSKNNQNQTFNEHYRCEYKTEKYTNETEFPSNLPHDFEMKQEDHTEKETELYQNNLCDYEIDQSSGSSELVNGQFCEDKSKNKKTTVSHVWNVFHQCQFCKYRTKRKYDLIRHIKAKHDEKTEGYICSQCEYKTKDKRKFDQHCEYIHGLVNNISFVNVEENIQ